MKSVVPVLTVVLALVVLWYGAAVWMNATWTYDQAARAGTTPTLSQVLADTMRQDRPKLPPPQTVLPIQSKIKPLSAHRASMH